MHQPESAACTGLSRLSSSSLLGRARSLPARYDRAEADAARLAHEWLGVVEELVRRQAWMGEGLPSWADLVEAQGLRAPRLSADHRRELVAVLDRRSEELLSQRVVAELFGVDHAQIHRDRKRISQSAAPLPSLGSNGKRYRPRPTRPVVDAHPPVRGPVPRGSEAGAEPVAGELIASGDDAVALFRVRQDLVLQAVEAAVGSSEGVEMEELIVSGLAKATPAQRERIEVMRRSAIARLEAYFTDLGGHSPFVEGSS